MEVYEANPKVDNVRNNGPEMSPSSCMWSQTYLQWALQVVWPERILFRTDYPHQYRPGHPGRSFLLDVDLSQGGKRVIRSRQLGKADVTVLGLMTAHPCAEQSHLAGTCVCRS